MPGIAVLQMTSGIDPEANFAVIEAAAREAGDRSGKGASVLFTPEMSILLDRDRKRAAHWIESDAPGQMQQRLQQLAIRAEIDIALGSMPVGSDTPGLWANRSFYFSRGGIPARTYDKIHMFDVELSTGETWRESAAYAPGSEAVIVGDSAIGSLGLTICYDLRFPELFERLGRASCEAIAVPAAFTVPTGTAHWHVLLRARAIEATAFVIAAAQVGKHEDGRSTYGHSLVVDPWGEVLLDLGGDSPDLGFCEIDLARIAEVRRQLPALENKRGVPRYDPDTKPTWLK
ncbi:MAG: carbon-nitrogen hydrolase family protein [Pseudomonadota bacterium]